MGSSDPSLRQLARQLTSMQQRLKNLETVPQIAHSSLDDHGMPVYDRDGNLAVTLGKQADGSFSATPVSGPVPPAPAGVSAEGDAGLVRAHWQGVFWAGAVKPMDFEAVQVLVDGTVYAAMHDPQGGSVTVPAFPGQRVVEFRTLSQAGRVSASVGAVTVLVDSLVAEQMQEARDRIDEAVDVVAGADQRITDAESAVEAARGRLTQIEAVDLPGIREDIDAIVVGEGGVKTFYQGTEPLASDEVPPSQGDIWVDTSDQNHQYIYRDGEWLSARDMSFLSTARNMTPWPQGTGDPHALDGQVHTVPSGEMKAQGGVFPAFPSAETVGIVLDTPTVPGVGRTTTTLPFQGLASNPGDPPTWGTTAVPFEGRPIGIEGTALFHATGQPAGATPAAHIEATFFDASGTPVGLRRRLIVNARDLDPDDQTESLFLDGYGMTHIAEIEGDLEPDSSVAEDVAYFAMSWHLLLPRASGNTATILSAEARVQVPASGIAPGAITTPKLGVSEDMRNLIVTESAILNHATLLGETVVEQINVRDKLIGTDGVFTGTVDFANVNVTGLALVDRLVGQTVTGLEVIGGRLRTASNDGTFIDISNVARDGWPAVAFSTPGLFKGASLAAYDGRAVDQNVWPNGTLVMNSGRVGSADSDASTAVAASPGEVILVSRGGAPRPGSSFRENDARAQIGGTFDAATDGRPTIQAAQGVAALSSGFSMLGVDANGPIWTGGRMRGSLLQVTDSLQVSTIAPLGNQGDISVSMRSTDQFALGGSLSVNGLMFNPGMPDSSTTSTNVRVGGSGLQFARVTSSRRYKKDIGDWAPDPNAVLALQPRRWRHDSENSADDPRLWGVGFIAEEVDDLELTELVVYEDDEDGNPRPDALNYDRFAAAQQVVLQKHEREITELRAENDELRARLDRLEALTA